MRGYSAINTQQQEPWFQMCIEISTILWHLQNLIKFKSTAKTKYKKLMCILIHLTKLLL